MVDRRTLTRSDLVSRELVHVSLVFLVTLLTERKVVTPGAVETEHVLVDRIHAFITHVPKVEAFLLDHLLIGSLHCVLLDRLCQLSLVCVEIVFITVQRFLLSLLLTILCIIDQIQVDVFRLLNILCLLIRRFVILLTEHSLHRLVIEVWNKVGLQFLLNFVDHYFVFQQIAIG